MGTKRTRLKWPDRTRARRRRIKPGENDYWAATDKSHPHHFTAVPKGTVSHYQHDACPSRHKSPDSAQSCARRRQSAPSRIIAVLTLS